jgi:hypothetical protein
VLRHKWFVFLAGRRVRIGLWLRITHDLSKFLPCEFAPYARLYCGERRGEPDFDYLNAWLHHQNHNKHHHQYWVLRNRENEVLPMPEIYIREMIADWLGASRAYTGSWDATEWIRQNIDDMAFEFGTLKRVFAILREIDIDLEDEL